MLNGMKICLCLWEYLMKLVSLTNAFPFLVLSKGKETRTSQNLRVSNGSFSLPRVWRHWSYASRKTRADRIMNGPWKCIREEAHESKSHIGILPVAHYVAERQPQISAVILNGSFQAPSSSRAKTQQRAGPCRSRAALCRPRLCKQHAGMATSIRV